MQWTVILKLERYQSSTNRAENCQVDTFLTRKSMLESSTLKSSRQILSQMSGAKKPDRTQREFAARANPTPDRLSKSSSISASRPIGSQTFAIDGDRNHLLFRPRNNNASPGARWRQCERHRNLRAKFRQRCRCDPELGRDGLRAGGQQP